MPTPDVPGVTIAEASAQLGESPETIQRWIDEGRIPAWKVVENGQVVWRVVIDDVEDTDQGMSRSDVEGVRGALTEKEREISALREEVALLKDQVATKDGQLAVKDQQVRQLSERLPGKRARWMFWKKGL